MSQDGKDISVTLKAGKDYDAPWIVVYGNHPDEVKQKLEAMSGLIEATVNTANHLKGVNAGAALPAVAQQAPPQQQAWGQQPQAPAQQPQQWQAPAPQQQSGPRLHPDITCGSCGSRVAFKTITSKASGKSFDLWSCPNQRSKGDGHYSEFAN